LVLLLSKFEVHLIIKTAIKGQGALKLTDHHGIFFLLFHSIIEKKCCRYKLCCMFSCNRFSFCDFWFSGVLTDLFAALRPELSRTKAIKMHRYKKGKQPVLTGLLEA